MASLRRSMGVVPAWDSMPVTVTSNQLMPCTPLHDADGLLLGFEDRPLLDMGFEEGAPRHGRRIHISPA